MPRNLTAYVSRSHPDRVHVARLPWRGVATITVEFGGAMDAGVTISSVTWRSTAGGLSVAAISGTRATVKMAAGWGPDTLECTATLSNGAVLNQYFHFDRSLRYAWSGDVPTSPGAYQSLTTP